MKINTEDIKIFFVENPNDIPLKLLLLADHSEQRIEDYINESYIYNALWNGKVVGSYVLFMIDKTTIEIKNIAVDEPFQGQGIGTKLINSAMEKSILNGFKKILIGTGNSSLGQLYLYQKLGFRITDNKPDFFVENCPEIIWENGIQCQDMIILTKEI